MKNLRVLDGKDRNGHPIEINVLSDIPGLEQFMEYLSSSTDHHSDQTVIEHLQSNPKYNEKSSKVNYQTNSKDQKVDKDDRECDSELKLRLKELEKKLATFVSKSQQENANTAKPMNLEEEKINHMKDTYRKRSSSKEKKDNSDIRIGNLMKELNKEQHKRIDVENKLQIVLNKFKEAQLTLINDRNSKADAMKSTEQLAAAYSKEKSTRHELESQMSELQVNKCAFLCRIITISITRLV